MEVVQGHAGIYRPERSPGGGKVTGLTPATAGVSRRTNGSRDSLDAPDLAGVSTWQNEPNQNAQALA
jgi:hypothetical protein